MSLDRFAPVPLDELVAEAALLTRVDRKYVLPAAAVGEIIDALDPRTRVLEHAGARDAAYLSVYFDTPDLVSFRRAAQPRRRRFKLRVRSYLDSGTAFLEIKTRGARGATVKDRVAYDPADAHRLTDVARAEVRAAFGAIGLDPAKVDDLAPVLSTRYRRATLLLPDAAGRATLDSALRWESPDGAAFGLPGVAIVETKSSGAASTLDRLLWRAGHRPATVSKYATGLAVLRPDLPRNRWHRLLAGAFHPETLESAWPVAA